MSHDHDHSHNMNSLPRSRLRIVFTITFLFMIVEAVVGFIANSLALIADAGHMLNDVISIALALIAIHLSGRKNTKPELTYGYKRVEVLSGLINGVSLILIGGYIIKEAIERTVAAEPIEIQGKLMLTVAFIGLLVNIIGILLLKEKKDDSINMEGAYEHIMADLLGSVAAIIAGIGIILYNAYWLDIVASVIVSILVLRSGIKITIKAVNILIEAIPDGFNIHDLKNELLSIDGVDGIYDLHAWRLTDGLDIVTAHINIYDETMYQQVRNTSTEIAKTHGFHHITFQIETQPCEDPVMNCCSI